MTHKVSFMVKPELADIIKYIAESTYTLESEVWRHLCASALHQQFTIALKNAKTEKEKEGLKLIINTQILPLLSTQIMGVKL